MTIRRRLLTALASSGALVAVLLAGSNPAATVNASPPTKVNYSLVGYQTRGIDKTFKGNFSGDWTHCNYITKASYTQMAGCTEGTTVTETITGNIGYSDGTVSSAVGFNVAYATTVTATNSVSVKPGGSGWFDVGFRYARYTIIMQTRLCFRSGCTSWSESRLVTVQQHLGNTFHYFGTGAK